MKRCLSVILALCMLLVISACSGSADVPNTPPTTVPISVPTTGPSATEPLATEPITTESPTTEPPVTEPPTTEPPATEPSGTEHHVHNYAVHSINNATCTEKGYTFYICSCGANYFGDYVDAIGHDWEDASCTQPQTCKNCHITEGIATEHDWIDASCTDPKKCSSCGLTEGVALPHNMSVATCQSPPTCKVCGYSDGDRAFHNTRRLSSDCTKDICTDCGEVFPSGNEHDVWFTSCVTPGKCMNCDFKDGKIPGHRFKNGKCTVCKVDVLIISDTQTISNQTIDTDVYITSTGVATFNNVTVNGNVYCYGELNVSGGKARNVYAYHWDLDGVISSCNAWDGSHGLIKGSFNNCWSVTITDQALNDAFKKWGQK